MFSTMDLHLLTDVLILFLLTIIDFLNYLLQTNQNYYYNLLFSIVSLVSAACYINAFFNYRISLSWRRSSQQHAKVS